ncbi:hypothetical protein [Tenacibaculum agarivorans]|uniref:hypothetical protein n=1 Tax=Tenacibaculum agarivorans TaxID=1908389 RepID=UPI00094B9A59|nr:hypothetical protein [Tenacibaculum agarivorans]
MEHPVEHIRLIQKKAVEQAPERLKEFLARTYRLGNASFIYHQSSKEFEADESDYQQWLLSIEDKGFQKQMKEEGFEKGKAILAFKRFVNEKYNIGYDAFLKEHLSKEDYEYHRSVGGRLKERT